MLMRVGGIRFGGRSRRGGHSGSVKTVRLGLMPPTRING